MSSSDFRQIALKTDPDGDAARGDRLFRAAVSAFCALTRPSRKDIIQLDDLALPRYDQASTETRRYVAAALSECRDAPLGLVRRLADEPIGIAAPILIRASGLADIDLIGLIARHGVGHARAIRSRKSLNPAIAALIRALEAAAAAEESAGMAGDSDNVETTRGRLRAMMAGERPPASVQAADTFDVEAIYGRLRDTALTGSPAFFQTALADALGISFDVACDVVESADSSLLMRILRGTGLTPEQAFLLTAALRPRSFVHPDAIRAFVENFRLLQVEAGRDAIREARVRSRRASAVRTLTSGPAA